VGKNGISGQRRSNSSIGHCRGRTPRTDVRTKPLWRHGGHIRGFQEDTNGWQSNGTRPWTRLVRAGPTLGVQRKLLRCQTAEGANRTETALAKNLLQVHTEKGGDRRGGAYSRRCQRRPCKRRPTRTVKMFSRNESAGSQGGPLYPKQNSADTPAQPRRWREGPRALKVARGAQCGGQRATHLRKKQQQGREEKRFTSFAHTGEPDEKLRVKTKGSGRLNHRKRTTGEVSAEGQGPPNKSSNEMLSLRKSQASHAQHVRELKRGGKRLLRGKLVGLLQSKIWRPGSKRI